MDWLVSFSPMHIDWQQQWLAIPYKGQYIVLQGMDASSPDSIYLQLYAIEEVPSADKLAEPLLPAVHQLVDSFADLFT
jgi:hypothetical protein